MTATLSVETGRDEWHRWSVTSLAPDIYLGLPRHLQLGLVTSQRAWSAPQAGGGICAGSCPSKLRNAALEVRWQPVLRRNWVGLLARVGLRESLDPIKPVAALGVSGRVGLPWGFELDSLPFIQLGLANRDQGNRHALHIPVTLAWSRCQARLFVRSSYDAELAVLADGYRVALGAGAAWAITPAIAIEAFGGFRSVFGPLQAFSFRSASLAVTYLY